VPACADWCQLVAASVCHWLAVEVDSLFIKEDFVEEQEPMLFPCLKIHELTALCAPFEIQSNDSNIIYNMQ